MYTHTTLAAASSFLSQRLSDTASRFYTAAELSAAIREALRVWNVLTSQDRVRAFIRTSASTAFYDLPTTLNAAADGMSGEYVRARTITDASILAEMRTHLLEDVQSTDMFAASQMISALQDARDQFLADSYTTLNRRSDPVDPMSAGIFDYPDTVTNVRRAVWRSSTDRYSTITTSDERTATAFNRAWHTPSTPRCYSLSASTSLRVRLIPPPSELGAFESIVTASGASLDGSGVLLGVPDDLAWGVKYLALSILFSGDGPSADPQRAKRAYALYQLAVQSALHISTVLHAEIDNRPVIPAAIYRTDAFRSGWQGTTTATPNTLSIVGPDLIALTPVPDAFAHSVTLDTVRNALVPATSGAYLQIGREHLSALLDYAQWICLFKLGGIELEEAEPLVSAFTEEARTFAFQRSAASSALSVMQQTAGLDAVEDTPENDPSDGVRNAEEIRQERNARRRKTTAAG